VACRNGQKRELERDARAASESGRLSTDFDAVGFFHLIAWSFRAFYDPLQKRGEVALAREQRKLAAIVAADVVGYSRLMGRDESGTLAALARTGALVAVSASCKLQA
jgi:hypothetical protein